MEELKLAISIAAVALSVIALFVNQLSARRRDIANIRPVLVFEYQESGWAIRNVGSGPAMDVIFSRLKGEAVHDHTRLPALADGSSFLLHFAKHDNAHTFVATYRDADERPYSSQSAHDVSSARPGFYVARPEPFRVARWWERPESDC